MRLLLVTNDYPPQPGGIQQYLRGLVSAYPEPILVLAPDDERADPGDGVVRYPNGFMWPTRKVRAWIEAQAARFSPDVILYGAPTPLGLLAQRVRASLGVPYAVLSHGAELTIPGAVPGLGRLIAGPLRAADLRLAVSRYTGAVVERIARRPVEVIGTGVDLADFYPRLDRTGGVPVVGCVSRFVPRKGQHRLLQAAAILAGRGVGVEVLLVGRGRTEESLRRLARRLGVAVRFEVDVPWDRLGALYREMDVFCMPCRSRWFGLETEGFGLVYLEAAASGLPVLAGDSGGAPETVIPGRTGFVVHSVADIVEALGLLLSDPERARSMGEEGRTRVEHQFSWDATVKRLVEALGRVAG